MDRALSPPSLPPHPTTSTSTTTTATAKREKKTTKSVQSEVAMTTTDSVTTDLNEMLLRMERDHDGGVEWNGDGAGNGGMDVLPETAEDMGPGE